MQNFSIISLSHLFDFCNVSEEQSKEVKGEDIEESSVATEN